MKEAIDDLPRVMPYRAKAPVLPGYHLEGRPQVPLILCGAGAFAFLYGLTALEGQDGRIPIAGPILIVAGREKPTEGLLVAFSYVYAVIYAMDSVLQVAGLGMIVGGFASPTKVQVKDAPARESKGPFFRLDPRGPALVF